MRQPAVRPDFLSAEAYPTPGARNADKRRRGAKNVQRTASRAASGDRSARAESNTQQGAYAPRSPRFIQVMTTANDVYDNPLIGRYASKEMSERWGPLRKFRTWRRLWLAL